MLTEHVPYSEVGVMESQVAEADTGNPLLRVLEVTRTAEGLVGRFNHFNGGQVPGNDTPVWRKKANQDNQQKESDAFGSSKLVTVLLNAARNLPGQIGSNKKPMNLAAHLIKATNKRTCPEVPATSKDPGQQGRPCCKCFDESGRPLYVLAVQLAIAGSKPSDKYCEQCCDDFAARCLISTILKHLHLLELAWLDVNAFE